MMYKLVEIVERLAFFELRCHVAMQQKGAELRNRALMCILLKGCCYGILWL